MVSAALYADNERLNVAIEHVKAHDHITNDYYVLRVGSDLTLFLEREQLIQIHDAIRDAYVPEIPAMRPVAARVIHPDVVLATEDDIEEARR